MIGIAAGITSALISYGNDFHAEVIYIVEDDDEENDVDNEVTEQIRRVFEKSNDLEVGHAESIRKLDTEIRKEYLQFYCCYVWYCLL